MTASSVYAVDETVEIREVVVSATKIEESVEETTSSVKIINEESIRKMHVEFIPDVLKRVSELNIIQNGGTGKQATVILRGGSSSQTLVMVDGVKVKSTTLGTFDFAGITSDDIERIEIVKGPQSTIYGSEAMAGVINIITKKGSGKTRTEASVEAGAHGTFSPSVTISGGSGKLDYRITGSKYFTDGISSAKSGSEKDGYENSSISGKFGFRPDDNVEFEVTGKYYHDRSELDAFGADDLNYVQEGNHYILSGKGTIFLLDNWEQIFSLSRVSDSLDFTDPDTAFNNAEIDTAINTVDWQNNLYVSDEYIFTLGAEYRDEKGENKGVFDKSVDNKAIYFNSKLKLLEDDLIINAGTRYDDHETFGDKTTYRVGGIYNVRKAMLKIKGSYGTGFRAPTLNELFYNDAWGSSGNVNLNPETSSSWEAGIEKTLVKDRAFLTVTYFEQDYENLIEWVESPPGSWQFSPQNISKAEVKGIEADINARITDNFRVQSSYTHIDTEDKDTGKRLTRRPDDKFTLSADCSHKSLSLAATYIYVGDVYDSSSKRDLDSYSLVNLSGSYTVNDNLKFFVRIDNLLDKDYETAGDFNTPGLSAFGGVKLSI
jgi:vitamin B12 transporter